MSAEQRVRTQLTEEKLGAWSPVAADIVLRGWAALSGIDVTLHEASLLGRREVPLGVAVDSGAEPVFAPSLNPERDVTAGQGSRQRSRRWVEVDVGAVRSAVKMVVQGSAASECAASECARGFSACGRLMLADSLEGHRGSLLRRQRAAWLGSSGGASPAGPGSRSG